LNVGDDTFEKGVVFESSDLFSGCLSKFKDRFIPEKREVEIMVDAISLGEDSADVISSISDSLVLQILSDSTFFVLLVFFKARTRIKVLVELFGGDVFVEKFRVDIRRVFLGRL
jgi:hypothetical protein